MAQPTKIARLQITPSGLFEPIVHTITLEQSEGIYCVLINEWNGLTKEGFQHRFYLHTVEVEERLADLKQVTVPAFPVSPLVCDGEYLELQIYGEHSHLTIGWWSIAPKGADGAADFAYWLRDVGLGSEDDWEDEDT